MRTLLWRLERGKDNTAALSEAAALIRGGGTVAFPTETVYGLGADGLSETAVKKIFAAKGRPADNPLILHIADKGKIRLLAREVPDCAEKFIENFWPGPLTLVLKKRRQVPDAVTAGLDTVAVRMPSHPVAARFINICGTPLAAPSANISGRPSPTEAQAVADDLMGRIGGIIDGGSAAWGIESTVVDCAVSPPVILRPGAVTREDIEKVSPVREGEQGSGAPRSPGMKYRHYAPRAPLYLLSPADAARLAAFLISQGQGRSRVGVLAGRDLLDDLPAGIIGLGGWRGEQDYGLLAANLYQWLREFDRRGAELILAQPVAAAGIGRAVNNRLFKAAGGKFFVFG
ncbi:MAG: threonylcarbamoyl-AMP synthase [Acidaminococcales bacterium]|jgi:L-threonylcarbamoyladenylate synthase|nr:threonylcarbamoyl-AMP synthase [Acidaminococcales bacterium]